jgi:hypothetical protein
MAEEGTFTNREEVLRKAGLNVSATSSAEEYTNDFIKQAEAFINLNSRKNWHKDYATLNVNVKLILKEIASNLAAIYVINYNPAIVNRIEAEIKIETLYKRAIDGLKLLEDQKGVSFIEGEA